MGRFYLFSFQKIYNLCSVQYFKTSLRKVGINIIENPDLINELIAACKKNERQAQIRIYELFAKKMFNVSKRIVKDSLLAEDIVQESFLAAFTSLDSFRGEVPFESWLKRIVINRSIDQYRKQKFITEELDESIHTAYEEPEWDIGDVSDTEFINEVKKCINQLADGYRTILSLYLIEGYDHDEISQILKISASTSRSQYTRAKRKLYELFEIKNVKK
jgi:RNA polymerase sigma factor (sigma-70 family)